MNTLASTLARYRLLTRALEGRGNIPPSLVSACASQGGLAKLSLPSEGITPLALNTLKPCADKVIETGGWKQLDAMRRQLCEVAKHGGIADRRRKPRSRVQALREREAELTEALSTERRYRLRLVQAPDGDRRRPQCLSPSSSSFTCCTTSMSRTTPGTIR